MATGRMMFLVKCTYTDIYCRLRVVPEHRRKFTFLFMKRSDAMKHAQELASSYDSLTYENGISLIPMYDRVNIIGMYVGVSDELASLIDSANDTSGTVLNPDDGLDECPPTGPYIGEKLVDEEYEDWLKFIEDYEP